MARIKTFRKRRLAAVVASAALAAVAYAELRKGYYTPSQLGSLQQAAPTELVSDANYEVSAYPVPTPDLAPGEGLAEVRIYCNTCHSPRYITMQPPLPATTWEAEVNKMNKAFGAAIPDETSHKIIAYLQAHYSTDTRH